LNVAAKTAAEARIIHPNASHSVSLKPTVNPVDAARLKSNAFTQPSYGE
jgi:hypothetical protein